jgi:hypothetical protein
LSREPARIAAVVLRETPGFCVDDEDNRELKPFDFVNGCDSYGVWPAKDLIGRRVVTGLSHVL